MELNRAALADPRLTVVNEDAMQWLRRASGRFDVIILDFPDPSNYSLGKLYSFEFYRLVRERLAPSGALAVQATSPLLARKAFWCVIETLGEVGFLVRPYHAFLPSFGEWGFALAALSARPEPDAPEQIELRFLSEHVLTAAFDFPKDMQPVRTHANRLNNQALVGYYLEEAKHWD